MKLLTLSQLTVIITQK